MWVFGTSQRKLSIHSITFKAGKGDLGGGMLIFDGAIVDLHLTIFLSNTATIKGGAIYASSTVNVYGTTFIENQAPSGFGGDIFKADGATATIHKTCSSPYALNSPIQGE